MNKQLLLQIADEIEAHPEHLDMGGFACNTSCCIAGFAMKLAEPQTFNDYLTGRLGAISFATRAQHQLGLDTSQTGELFYTNPYTINERRHQVPAALRWMAETGYVDWDRAFQEVVR